MLISVHITTKSSKSQIIGWVEGEGGKKELKIKIAAPPEDGKANAELIRFLSKEWGVPKNALEITGGEASRHKRLKIHDSKLAEILTTSSNIS